MPVCVPALVLTGCSSKKKSSDSGSTAQPTQASGAGASQPTAASGSSNSNTGGGSSVSSSELATIVGNFLKAKSFSMTLQDSKGAAQGTFDYVAPDKYHYSLAGTELIAIGKDSYVKQGGTWIKLPAAAGAAASPFNADTLKTQLDQVSKAKATKNGSDTVNGVKCDIYNVTDTDGTTTEVCVANGLPIRIKDGTTIIVISNYDKVPDIKGRSRRLDTRWLEPGRRRRPGFCLALSRSLADDAEELAAGAGIGAESAEEAVCDDEAVLLLDAAHHHAEVARLDHHADALRLDTSSMASAIWVVRRSCTCRRRA